MTNIGHSGEKRGIHSGKTIDNEYLVGDLLCQDTLGGLYRCTDKSDDEYVIKLFTGGIHVTSSTADAPLHPNILTPQAISEPSKLPRYVVFDSSVTMTLREWMKNRLHGTAEHLIGIMLQLTSAINGVHSLNRAIGDLCPETIFIGEDFVGKMEVYILDIDITYSKNTVANKWYCAPEQLTDNNLMPASDIWALGAIVYETVYRRKPFLGKNEKEILQRIQTGNLKFSTYTKVPSSFVGVIRKCLQADISQRYDSMVVLGGDLLLVQEQLGKDVNSEAANAAIRQSIPPAKRISIVPPPNSKSKRNSIPPPPMAAKGTVSKRISAVPPAKISSRTKSKQISKTPVSKVALKRISKFPKSAMAQKKPLSPTSKTAKKTVLGMNAPKIAPAPKANQPDTPVSVVASAPSAPSVSVPTPATSPKAIAVSAPKQKTKSKPSTKKKKNAFIPTAPPPNAEPTFTTPIDTDEIELTEAGAIDIQTDDSMENLLSDLSTSEIELLEFTEPNVLESPPAAATPKAPADTPPPVEPTSAAIRKKDAGKAIGTKLLILKKSLLDAAIWQAIKKIPSTVLHAEAWQKIKALPIRILRAALWKRISTSLKARGQKFKSLPASMGAVGPKIQTAAPLQWARTKINRRKVLIVAALLLCVLIVGIFFALSGSAEDGDNGAAATAGLPTVTPMPPKGDSTALQKETHPSPETQTKTEQIDTPAVPVADSTDDTQQENAVAVEVDDPDLETKSTGSNLSSKKAPSKKTKRTRKTKKRRPGWASNPFGK